MTKNKTVTKNRTVEDVIVKQIYSEYTTGNDNNTQDNMDQTIPFLCLLLHNNLLT